MHIMNKNKKLNTTEQFEKYLDYIKKKQKKNS